MAYSGKFVPKNREKYKGDHTKIVWRSKWELHAFKWADTNSQVKSWSSEETIIPYYYDIDKKYHRYFMDLRLNMANGRTILVEIKPHSQTMKPKYPGKKTARYINESLAFVKNQNKWDAAKIYAADRKWEFEIWTEHELHAMKIMPKAGNFKSLGKSPGKTKASPRGKGLKVSPKPYPKFKKEL